MGSSSSRLCSSPHQSRPGSNHGHRRNHRPNRSSRTLSSLLLCGGSSSATSPPEIEDEPSQLRVNLAKNTGLEKSCIPAKDSSLSDQTGCGFTGPETETGVCLGGSVDGGENAPLEQSGMKNVEENNKGKCLSESKELVPPPDMIVDRGSSETASTSYGNESSSEAAYAIGRVGTDYIDSTMNGDVSLNSTVCNGSLSSWRLEESSSDAVSVENHSHEVTASSSSDSGSLSVVSGSPTNSQPLRASALHGAFPSGLGFLVSEREEVRREGGVLHVDVVSISSNILSSNSAEINSREARRNSRRLFWDAFSRRSSRRLTDSRTFVFTNDDSDELGSHDRWLVDFSGDILDESARGGSISLGSRGQVSSERRRHPRSEIWERLRVGLDGSDRRRNVCPTGIHPEGTCSCESVLTSEESGARGTVSRMVMLAEALFEVLDEIHRQPMSLSLSVVSLPAPESVVNSFPVKNHRKPERSESGDDVAQCYICLAEYEEGDKIRILPCHHEYHVSCVDKWLKEIHGVCPLCRGDVREGFTDGSG